MIVHTSFDFGACFTKIRVDFQVLDTLAETKVVLLMEINY